jgi:hypothetical protein
MRVAPRVPSRSETGPSGTPTGDSRDTTSSATGLPASSRWVSLASERHRPSMHASIHTRKPRRRDQAPMAAISKQRPADRRCRSDRTSPSESMQLLDAVRTWASAASQPCAHDSWFGAQIRNSHPEFFQSPLGRPECCQLIVTHIQSLQQRKCLQISDMSHIQISA